MSRETTTTYGTRMSPCWFGRGESRCTKSRPTQGDAAGDHTSNFTQVQAAVRRKSLLLLWWIDGGRVVVERSTLAWQDGSGYTRMGV